MDVLELRAVTPRLDGYGKDQHQLVYHNDGILATSIEALDMIIFASKGQRIVQVNANFHGVKGCFL
jgi:hypothetical protein